MKNEKRYDKALKTLYELIESKKPKSVFTSHQIKKYLKEKANVVVDFGQLHRRAFKYKIFRRNATEHYEYIYIKHKRGKFR